jgi:3-methyl-2-oxobutanoate hydroxymethyltransferase
MSTSPIQLLREAKRNKQRLAMISLYDAPTSILACDAGADLLLVGDSLGNVVLGFDHFLDATISDMVRHTGAVVRGVRASSRSRVPVFADLPFGTYATRETAAQNGAELMRAGADGLKLEGANDDALAAIRVLTSMGAPVCGHLGFTPQSSLLFEGIVQGKTAPHAQRLFDEARVLQDAGCCALVLEATTREVAARITQELDIVVIGIGAGEGCDGQVLVWHDLVGLSPGKFRFVKRYLEAREILGEATRQFVEEVHNGAFPATENGWAMPDDEWEKWRKLEGK